MKYRIPKSLLLVLFPCVVLGQFGDPMRISMPMAEGVKVIREADLDGDGDKDILSGSEYNGQIAWYKNDGTGHFSAEKDIASNPGINYISDVVAMDMDGDGDLDIVSVANFFTADISNEIAIYPNLGNGEFGMKQLLSAQVNSATALAVFDADNDGDPDITCSVSSSDLVVYIENNGNMSFGSQTTLSATLDDPTRIEAADIDGDDDDDLLVLASGGVYRMINTNGTFGPAEQMANNSYSFAAFQCGDMNGDSYPDIVACNSNGAFLEWYENNGSGQFGGAQTIFTGAEVMDVFPADMDNDGDMDVAAVVFWEDELRWYERTADGTFTEHLIEAVRGSRVLVTDIDEDGDADVLSASHEDNVIRCHLRENDTFLASVRLAGGTYVPKSLAHADIDGDGDIDLVCGSFDFVNWFPNTGNGTFGDLRVVVPTTFSGFFRVATEDIDNDGDVDVITYTESGDVLVMALNDGAGNFVSSTLSGNPGSILKELFFLDYDNDGDKDIFSAGSSAIMLSKNAGNGNFTSVDIDQTVFTNALALTMHDMNGDGRLDPFYAYQNHIGYHTTNLNGTFSNLEHVMLNNQNYSAVEFGDFDEDGLLDILCGNTSGTMGWLKGTSNGYWDWEPFVPIGSTLSDIIDLIVVDPDNDGDLDLFCIYGPIGSYQVNYYEHTDNMQFVEYHISNLGQVETLDFYDYDNDGDLDLFAGAKDQVVVADNQLHAPYQAKGVLFLDHNQNGVKDADDEGLPLVKVLSDPQAYYAFSGQDGTYYLNFDSTPGTYTLLPQANSNWSITGQSSYTTTVSGPQLQLDTLDFGFYPTTPVDSIVPTLTGGFPRCNTVVNYYLNTSNRGSTVVSGVLALELDPAIGFVSAAVAPDSTNGQHVYWHFDSISYFSDELLVIQVQLPDFTSMGNSLNSTLTATVYDAADNATYIGTDTLSQILVCAYDPNDKAVMPAGEGPDGIIPIETPYLDYFVRFQNTGNDTAVTIIVRDVIDENLDYLGLVPLASSHQMEINVEPDGKIAFIFENICFLTVQTMKLPATVSCGFGCRLQRTSLRER